MFEYRYLYYIIILYLLILLSEFIKYKCREIFAIVKYIKLTINQYVLAPYKDYGLFLNYS